MINVIKKICFTFIWLSCLARPENSDDITIPLDISVYNGEGSILLNWFIPDSIKVKKTIIYSQKFGEKKFKEIASLPSKAFFFLDTNCDPGDRYFYKVVIQDIHDNFFSDDLGNLPFGSCESISENIIFYKNITSLNNLFFKYLKDKLVKVKTGNNFDFLLEHLITDKINQYNMIENLPSNELKTLSEPLNKIFEVISNSNFLKDISSYENYYRNHLFLTPKTWDDQVNKTILIIRDNWDILYREYLYAIDELNKLAPIRIVGSKDSYLEDPKITLNVFHDHQVLLKEWYLLSGDEYIDLEKFFLTNTSNFSVEVPKHWDYVSLMANDLIIQTVPIIKNKSVFYTLDGDIIPHKKNDKSLMKFKRETSSLWLNEIIWEPELRALNIEIVGTQELDERYFLTVQNERIWNINPLLSFSSNYIDSLFIFESSFEFPFIIELQNVNDSLTNTIEYIVLDTNSKIIGRLDDTGPWENNKINTIGFTNETNQNNFDSQLVPQIFVLYQNYPNPFNGQTKITFDLLEDAKVSLYITDAKGRVQEKILEEEFYRSGIYHFLWEAENLSSGVYFITLQAEVDNFPMAVFSRKVIYLK